MISWMIPMHGQVQGAPFWISHLMRMDYATAKVLHSNCGRVFRSPEDALGEEDAQARGHIIQRCKECLK